VLSAAFGQTAPVLSRFRSRLRAAATAVVGRIKSAIREATRPLPLVTGLAVDLPRSRKELLTENAFLRQQLIVVSRRVKRPAFRSHERGLLVLLARLVPRWRDAVVLVKPDTILRWHRQGFRLFWRLKSRRPGKPRPRLMNSTCERFLGSVRREALDHIVILGERHLKSVLSDSGFAVSLLSTRRVSCGISR
jgi:hypothetical protein